MQPLPTTQRMMTWLSMCPADESSNARQKKAHFAYTLAIAFINLISCLGSMVFCMKFVSTDFDGATFAFMVAIGGFGLIYILIAAILMRHEIGSIFTSLSKIYSCNENEIGQRYLARANNTSEWMWTFYFKYIAVSLSGIATTSLLSVLYCYLTQDELNVQYFYKIGRFVLPWNQTTYLGYLAEVCATITMAYGYFIVNGTPLLFFISLCVHHQAFSKIFKQSIQRSVEWDAKRLCDLIRFHISAKDLFLESANAFRLFVLVQLICCTVVMTISVFYLDLQWHEFDFTMASAMISTSIGMSNLFLYCYFGKLATESYEMMSDCVCNMNWYEQPIELQKYFILMIANMQKPVYYHGFEVAKLDLRSFIKLCNSVFSYYMVIKTLAAK